MDRPTLVFTDLDATLLDHDTYRADEALPVLADLEARGIPVIPVTSKTRAEVEELRGGLGLRGPYVTENGAGVFLPAGASLEGGAPGVTLGALMGHAQVRQVFRTLAPAYGLTGMSDMVLEDVVARTGLSLEAAALACRREYSEPFVITDPSRLGALEEEARGLGLRILRGGRFLHLLDARASKGHALVLLRDAHQRRWGQRPQTVALGDSPNDLDMLLAADHGIVVPGPRGVAPGMDVAGLTVAPHPGPRGWAAAVRQVLG
jgi:mannosyl-3-phosphoglycerate phosphatase